MSPTRSCTTGTISPARHRRQTAARTIPSLMTGAATDLDIEIDIEIDIDIDIDIDMEMQSNAAKQ